MPSAFISYNHQDKELARRIANELRDAGIDVWIDEGELRVGDSLIARIADGVYEADFLVALVTQHSVESGWCQKELGLALTSGINARRVKVLPVVAKGTPIPATLGDLVYIELSGLNVHEATDKLIADLYRLSANPAEGGLTSSSAQGVLSSTEQPAASEAGPVGTGAGRLPQLAQDAIGRLNPVGELTVHVSLCPGILGTSPLDTAKLNRLRAAIQSRRVVPASRNISWKNAEVARRRFELDAGRDSNGLTDIAALLGADGAGAFAMTLPPQSTDGSRFVFSVEGVSALVHAGVWLLGWHLANTDDVVPGPVQLRAGIRAPDGYTEMQPGRPHPAFNDGLPGTRSLSSVPDAQVEALSVDVTSPSPQMIACVAALVGELLQPFGMPECPQFDLTGRVRAQSWSTPYRSVISEWAHHHRLGVVGEDW